MGIFQIAQKQKLVFVGIKVTLIYQTKRTAQKKMAVTVNHHQITELCFVTAMPSLCSPSCTAVQVTISAVRTLLCQSYRSGYPGDREHQCS